MGTFAEIFSQHLAPGHEAVSPIEKKRTAISEQRGEVRAGDVQRVMTVPSVRSIDQKARTIDFVSSDETVDRYGDIIRVKGWDLRNYEKNPVFLWAHRAGDPPIGRTVKIWKEANPSALVQRVEFADEKTYPFGATIFNLYAKGFMRAVSVGFRPTENPNKILDETNDWTGGYEFVGQELLELSAVPIPANPNALAKALDSGAINEADAQRCFVAEPEPDQADIREKLMAEMLDLRKSLLDLQFFVTARQIITDARELSRMLGSARRSPSLAVRQHPVKHDVVPQTISTAAQLESALRGGLN